MSVEKAVAARQEGRYEEALRLILALFDKAGDEYFIVMFTWRLLMDDYPPAREAFIRTRDAQAAQLLAGSLHFEDKVRGRPRSRFQQIASMNHDLQDHRATYELFLQLLAMQPDQARREAFVALPAIVEAGDYVLAEPYLDDPLPRQQELNGLAGKFPLFPPIAVAPRLAAELSNFIQVVRLLSTVHQGLGRIKDAEALRDAALAGLASKPMRGWAARELAEPGVLFREIARLEVRHTTEDDWQELKRIRLDALLDAPTAFGVSHADAAAYADEAWRDRAAGRGPARYILAFEGDKAVGMVAHVPDADHEQNLIAMWVQPSERGQSTAGRLMDAVKAQGFPRILLDVAPTNRRAAEFYLKHGFTFLPQSEPLKSHPHIQVQKMEWLAC